jgi:hypothetical protein
MTTIGILAILLAAFIPVFLPLVIREGNSENLRLYLYSYLAFTFLAVSFFVLGFFADLQLGYGLGDLAYHFIFYITLIVCNVGMGFRKRMKKPAKYFMAGIQIMMSIYLIVTVLENNTL